MNHKYDYKLLIWLALSIFGRTEPAILIRTIIKSYKAKIFFGFLIIYYYVVKPFESEDTALLNKFVVGLDKILFVNELN